MLVRVCLLAALAISVDSFSYYPIFAGHSRVHARTQRVARTCSSGMRVLPRMAYSMSGAGGGHVEDKIETKENVLRKYVGRVWKVFEAAEWENMKRIGTENEAILCAEFRAAHCRKCQALAPRYEKVPPKYEGKPVIFLEIDAQKVGAAVRAEASIEKVPTFQIWYEGKKVDGFLSGDIADTIPKVERMVERNIALAKGAANFEGLEPLSQEEFSQVTDPLAAWRSHQANVVRAPGISSQESSTTLSLAGSENSAAASNGAVISNGAVVGNGGGSSVEEMLAELEAIKAKKAAAEAEANAPKMKNGGGNTAEELMAQLEAIAAKQKEQQ